MKNSVCIFGPTSAAQLSNELTQPAPTDTEIEEIMIASPARVSTSIEDRYLTVSSGSSVQVILQFNVADEMIRRENLIANRGPELVDTSSHKK